MKNMKKSFWILLVVFVLVAAVEFGYILHSHLSKLEETTAPETESHTESVTDSDTQTEQADETDTKDASTGSVAAGESDTTESTSETDTTETVGGNDTTESTSETDTSETAGETDTTESTSETDTIETEGENDTTESETEETEPVEPGINYGTLDNPVTVTYAYNACADLNNGESSLKPFYVRGTVIEIGETGKYYKNVKFTDGDTVMLIYTINMKDGIDGFEVGDTITAYGYIKNYEGIIEMATYQSSVYVYVVKVESESGDQGGSSGGSSTSHTYTDFTSEEKSIWTQYIGEVIPFIPNDEYYVGGYYDEMGYYEGVNYEYGVNFYAFDNTEAEFNAYRQLFSDYTLEDTYTDEYDDTWYQYVKDDIVVDMSFYTVYDEDNGTYTCVDVYVYSSLSKDIEDSDGSGDGYEDPDDIVGSEINYGTLDNPVTTTYALNACADLAYGEFSAQRFYVKGTVTDTGYIKTNNTTDNKYYQEVYFTDGTSEMLIFTLNKGDGITGIEVGDVITVYGYITNYNGTIELASKNKTEYVYVVKVESESGTQGGGSSYDDNVSTNAGKGLPQSANGIYKVDLTKGNPVQNVTGQGYYKDGCPTVGTPAVLVIPVEFSDIPAASKGFTIENIEIIFNDNKNELTYYSVDEYFFKSSYGKLDLDITVLDSWFRPKNSSSYYAEYYETYDGYDYYIGDQLILDEALEYLEDKMDLSIYDSDGNGIIDAVIMINTLEIGEDDFHWAYRYWNIYTDEDEYYYEYDGVSANDYVWVAYEFMFEEYDDNGNVDYSTTNPLNPYTFIHEFSHVLGADDYYDTEDNENAPLGGCDVMDAMAGDHNPYSKFNYGWITESSLIVTDSSVTFELEAFAKNGDTVILANNWDDTLGAYQEYYVIMYYTIEGLNDGVGGYFKRDGIVVYHVNAVLYSYDGYDGKVYYDVYNSNTSASSEYGTEDNLIEIVIFSEDNYTFGEGDSLQTLTDDFGNELGYTFTVVSLGEEFATLTFTKK